MATPRKWSGVAVAMQSAIAAGIVITGISNANPAVVTFTGSAPANGSVVLIKAFGMSQVDGRMFRVAASGSGTFALEGEDSTLYDTFTSGGFQVITLGVSITTATTVAAAGGTFPFIDTTTIHASVKSQIPGLPDAASYTMENIWDVSDAGLIAMKSASQLQAERGFKFTFGTGGLVMLFYGFVGATLLPGGQAQQLVTTPSVITMNGLPTYYAS